MESSLCCAGSKSTCMEPPSRFTFTSDTPSNFRTAFSTWAEQAEQVMPVTVNFCLIIFLLSVPSERPIYLFPLRKSHFFWFINFRCTVPKPLPRRVGRSILDLPPAGMPGKEPADSFQPQALSAVPRQDAKLRHSPVHLMPQLRRRFSRANPAITPSCRSK